MSAHAGQYRFGGAPADNNHTRIIGVAIPEGASATYVEVLSAYPSTAKPIDGLDPDDFAVLPIFVLAEQ